MLVPLYDPSTIFTAKPTPTSTPTPTPISTTISISQNSTTTSESTSIKQTYSYSGPPKSYYSRLPLYDRPFKCDQCPQSKFQQDHDLKRHKRIHLVVKPYPGQYCEKQFSRMDALKRHVLVHKKTDIHISTIGVFWLNENGKIDQHYENFPSGFG
ncbi:hypothetical protein RhiirA4_360225 [Rhizophagus irregularis]|uniref:C2H2-type domain-containing protein n=1 Tax=Rhizophagus irregularis TaxID=588596 RepID=A0A2I1GT54_9GLOM|nr:hypothetical protein RhiirA4_360225 [Rhizophagus irregularis]